MSRKGTADHGAVAVVTAIMAVMLFVIAALVVDLGIVSQLPDVNLARLQIR